MAKGKIRKVTIERDLNDQLMIEMIKYFEASEIWESKGWDYKGIEARNALGAMRVIARKRRMEIQEQRKLKRIERKQKGENNE